MIETGLPEWLTKTYTEEEASRLRAVVEIPCLNGRMRFYLHQYVGPSGTYFSYDRWATEGERRQLVSGKPEEVQTQ